MIKSMLIIAILATVGFKTYAADIACKPNEVYSTCGTCEATCDNQNPLCHKNCQPPGCYCPVGFVRDANNDCVPVSSCPIASSNNQSSGANNSICKENEYFTNCGGCDPICGNLNQICTMMCHPAGCYCLDGFARDANGRCVATSDCPLPNIVMNKPGSEGGKKKCKPNESYTDCGSCEPTCDTLNAPCIAMCKPPGCYCRNGFVRNDNGDCVSVLTCSTPTQPINNTASNVCKKNEHYTDCGGCEPQCGQPILPCTLQCRPAGCYCSDGFSRMANGSCVPDSECPAVSGASIQTKSIRATRSIQKTL